MAICAAKRQFVIDCHTVSLLRVAVTMLTAAKHVEMTIGSMGDEGELVQWTILPNKWSVREGWYRMNVYDAQGNFVAHAYDWSEVGSIMQEEQ